MNILFLYIICNFIDDLASFKLPEEAIFAHFTSLSFLQI